MAEVAGLTSFSFGEDEESRYVMLFKKVSSSFKVDFYKYVNCFSSCCIVVYCSFDCLVMKEFAPSDEELEAYRKGEEWDPKKAEERRRLKVRGLV